MLMKQCHKHEDDPPFETPGTLEPIEAHSQMSLLQLLKCWDQGSQKKVSSLLGLYQGTQSWMFPSHVDYG